MALPQAHPTNAFMRSENKVYHFHEYLTERKEADMVPLFSTSDPKLDAMVLKYNSLRAQIKELERTKEELNRTIMEKFLQEQVGLLVLPSAEVLLSPTTAQAVDMDYVKEFCPEAVAKLPNGFRITVKVK